MLFWNESLQSERERKEISGLKKLANDRAKKLISQIRNEGLQSPLNDDPKANEDAKEQYHVIFLTEGDSASVFDHQIANVQTQAFFHFEGQAIWTALEWTKKSGFNEMKNLIFFNHALKYRGWNRKSRYRKIVIATDAERRWHAHPTDNQWLISFSFFQDLVKMVICLSWTPHYFRSSKQEKNTKIYCYTRMRSDNVQFHKPGQ